MTWKELRGQLVVATVALLTTFIAYTSQIFVIWGYLGGASVRTLLVLVPLNVFIILLYINYALVCLTDPGSVPENWVPDPQTHMEVKRSTHEPRFCKTCSNYKPPRTHHCSTCGRCVLKMDHHCPWINNCVGFHNYGHFIRFITYIEISAIYLFVLLGCRLAQVIRQMNEHNIRPTTTEAAFLAINLILAFAAIVTVGILSGYHVYCLSTNTTTIEGWEKGTALTIKSHGKIRDVKYPYNLGWHRNVCAVLGQQPLLWLWPQRAKGTGLHFSTRMQQPVSASGDDEAECGGAAAAQAEKRSTMHEDTSEFATLVRKPSRLHTRASTSSNLRVPTTPASVLTFNTTSTLVDPFSSAAAAVAKLPSVSKEAFELPSR